MTRRPVLNDDERSINAWDTTSALIGGVILDRLLEKLNAAATHPTTSSLFPARSDYDNAETLYSKLMAKLFLSFDQGGVNHSKYLAAYQRNRNWWGRNFGSSFTVKYADRSVSDVILNKLRSNTLDTATILAINEFLTDENGHAKGADYCKTIAGENYTDELLKHMPSPDSAQSPRARTTSL